MSQRYTVHYLGPLTRITEDPDGEWLRWEMARRAAIEHIEELVAECEETLWVLGRAGNFWEYGVFVKKMAGSEAGEPSQGQT